MVSFKEGVTDLRVTLEEGSGIWGECLSKKMVRDHIRNLTFIYDSAHYCLGHVLQRAGGGANAGSSPLQTTWPHKIDIKAAILWSSLAKLSTP